MDMKSNEQPEEKQNTFADEDQSLNGVPFSIEELIVKFQQLTERVRQLEKQLKKNALQGDLGQLKNVEFRIGKLVVKELSGTLNIGITSFGDDKDVTDFTSLRNIDLLHDEDDEESDYDESWYIEEGWLD